MYFYYCVTVIAHYVRLRFFGVRNLDKCSADRRRGFLLVAERVMTVVEIIVDWIRLYLMFLSCR